MKQISTSENDSSSAARSSEMAYAEVLDYAKAQRSTGFLVIVDGNIIVERNWPLSASATRFASDFTHGTNKDGILLEDVASHQKSVVAVLSGIAIDKGLLDVSSAVSSYAGSGWSLSSATQEAQITVLNLLEMNSGLNRDFTFDVAAGERFLYNTPVFAVMKRVLESAARESLESLTHEWLTGPAEMTDTSWRRRNARFKEANNPSGLVTTPRDLAKFAQVVLDNGCATGGRRIISGEQLQKILTRSPTNPAYGRLWWLNGGLSAIRSTGVRSDGPFIPAAPNDLVAAIGVEGRKLYIVPSRRLIVVRTGQKPIDGDPADTGDAALDQQLWLRLMKVLDV